MRYSRTTDLFIAVGLGLVLGSRPALGADGFGSSFLPLDASARGAALGGNVASLVGGSESIYWNPAGLLALEHREVSFSYADLFGLGLVSHSVVQFGWPQMARETRWEKGRIRSVKLPPPARRAFGLAATNLGAELDNDSYRETQVAVAYAWRLPAGIRAGAVYRFLSATSTLARINARGRAVDLGLQRPLGRVRLGFSATGLASHLNWDHGLDEPLPQRWALGLGWTPRRYPLAVTAQGTWRGPSWLWLQAGAGLEWRAVGPLTLRTGLRMRRDALETDRTEWSAGAGFNQGRFHIDYGLQSNKRGLGETHRWSAALAL